LEPFWVGMVAGFVGGRGGGGGRAFPSRTPGRKVGLDARDQRARGEGEEGSRVFTPLMGGEKGRGKRGIET